jgi:hypothetical protein
MVKKFLPQRRKGHRGDAEAWVVFFEEEPRMNADEHGSDFFVFLRVEI